MEIDLEPLILSSSLHLEKKGRGFTDVGIDYEGFCFSRTFIRKNIFARVITLLDGECSEDISWWHNQSAYHSPTDALSLEAELCGTSLLALALDGTIFYRLAKERFEYPPRLCVQMYTYNTNKRRFKLKAIKPVHIENASINGKSESLFSVYELEGGGVFFPNQQSFQEPTASKVLSEKTFVAILDVNYLWKRGGNVSGSPVLFLDSHSMEGAIYEVYSQWLDVFTPGVGTKEQLMWDEARIMNYEQIIFNMQLYK